MKAILDRERLFIIMIPDPFDPTKEVRLPNAPRFRNFWGMLGWPDLAKQGPYAQTWFALVGEQEDGQYAVMVEYGGDLGDVAKFAIDQKDIFLLNTIYVDDEDKASLEFLRDPDHCDGLTFYAQEDFNEETGLPEYRHSGSHWQYFRDDYPYQVTVSLVPVQATIRLNLQSGYQRLVAMFKKDQLSIDPLCQTTRAIIQSNSPLRDIIEHPLTKALVGGICMIELHKPGPEIKTEPPWYGNL